MRRKLAVLLLVCLIICSALSCAFAAVPATPNQKLAFRTGPNTKYVELYTLPKSTSISAIEYEEGNGVTWVLVEFVYNGETVRGYTGLKRMRVNGSIPWANPIGSYETAYESGCVWAAPAYNAAYRGWLNSGDGVTLLAYEGNFAFIEFYDNENGAYSRGYVDRSLIEKKTVPVPPGGNKPIIITPGSGGVSAVPNQELFFRTGPNTAYPSMFSKPQDTRLIAYEYEEGNGVTWVLVEFEHQGMRCRGYTGLKRMEVNGRIDWANHLNYSARTSVSSTVYAAPSANAYYRGRVDKREWVDVLDYENGYAYIEYYDVDQGMYSRGYVPSSVVR